MKKNIISYIKIFLFKYLKPVENIFAYNRMRRDKWILNNAKN